MLLPPFFVKHDKDNAKNAEKRMYDVFFFFYLVFQFLPQDETKQLNVHSLTLLCFHRNEKNLSLR